MAGKKQTNWDGWSPAFIVECPGTPGYNDAWHSGPVYGDEAAAELLEAVNDYDPLGAGRCPFRADHHLTEVMVHDNGSGRFRRVRHAEALGREKVPA